MKIKQKMEKISGNQGGKFLSFRPMLLKLAVVALVLLIGVGSVGDANPTWAAEEIPILALLSLTGPYAYSGMVMDRAAKLAIEHAGGKVLGKRIKYVLRDSETKSGVAVRRTEAAIADEKVKAVIGPWSSSVALAVSEVTKKNKIPHILSCGSPKIVGERCHKYIFNWAVSPYTASTVVVKKFLEENPNAKRWYTITVDYAFGHGVLEYTMKAGEASGVKFVGNDYHQLGEREFGHFLTKIMAKKPGVLCLINAGLDAISAIRQAENYGVKKKSKIVLPYAVGVEELAQLTPKTREGLYVGTNFYFSLDNPVAKRFVEDYHKKYKEFPGYPPAAAYSMTRILLMAMERAKSTDPDAIVEALEGWEIDGLTGKVKFRPEDHQGVANYFLLKCKKESQMKHSYDFADIIAMDNTPLPLSMSKCPRIK